MSKRRRIRANEASEEAQSRGLSLPLLLASREQGQLQRPGAVCAQRHALLCASWRLARLQPDATAVWKEAADGMFAHLQQRNMAVVELCTCGELLFTLFASGLCAVFRHGERVNALGSVCGSSSSMCWSCPGLLPAGRLHPTVLLQASIASAC
jgi:hypothetical protein